MSVTVQNYNTVKLKWNEKIAGKNFLRCMFLNYMQKTKYITKLSKFCVNNRISTSCFVSINVTCEQKVLRLI